MLLALVTPPATAEDRDAPTVTAGQPCWVRSGARRSGTSPLAGCAFGGGVALKTPLPSGLLEASGVAASGNYPGRLYTHNDGAADGGALYALDASNASGAVVGLYRLRGPGSGGGGGGERGSITSSTESDWEDVAVARQPLARRRWMVFVGDIGNNEGRRRTVRVYRFEEPPPPPPPQTPAASSLAQGADQDVFFIDRFDTIRLEYPKEAKGDDTGRYPDAETLIVDPHRGDIFIVTKEKKAKGKEKRRHGGARVYRASYPYSTQRKNRLALVGRLGFPGEIVGGDVAQSGDELLLKTPGEVLYFRRGTQEVSPQPYVREAQGEAIGFAADGSGYYTLSEHVGKRGKISSGQSHVAAAAPDSLMYHPRRVTRSAR